MSNAAFDARWPPQRDGSGRRMCAGSTLIRCAGPRERSAGSRPRMSVDGPT
ncbi:hypothetical protein ACIQMJ_09385 [Actinosynnema sp. NPDC091369]